MKSVQNIKKTAKIIVPISQKRRGFWSGAAAAVCHLALCVEDLIRPMSLGALVREFSY